MATLSLTSSSALLFRTLRRPIFRSQIKLNNNIININNNTNYINSCYTNNNISCIFTNNRKFSVVTLATESVTNSFITDSVANNNYNNNQTESVTENESVTDSVATESGSVATESDSVVTESFVEKNNKNNNKNEKNEEMKGLGNLLEIRVGKIVKIWKHEEADSLYVEEVDIGEKNSENGENSNRVICSGLVKYIPIHLLQDKKVVVLANLKPRNMRGVKSSGMLMAASDSSHENVELLEPPEDSVPGDRVWFGDVDEKDNLPEVASPNQIQKKKIWESVQPHLKTNASCVALLGEDVMRTSAGVVTCKSLKEANIS